MRAITQSPLGSSIQTAEIDDSAVTAAKLAEAVRSVRWTNRFVAHGTALGVNVNGPQTYYAPPVGDASLTATENQVQYAACRAGSVTGLRLSVGANSLGAVGATFVLMVNGAASALSCAIDQLADQVIVATGGPIAIAAGDLLSLRVVTPATTGTVSMETAMVEVVWS